MTSQHIPFEAPPNRRSFLALAAGAALLPGMGFAQDTYPQRPIKLLVGFAAGGTPDSIARTIAEQVSRSIGQSLVIENRAGANGMIAAQAVAKAAPDGYTLLLTTPSIVINPSVYKKVPYDLAREILPITDVAMGDGYLLVVNPALGVDTIPAFLDYAKRNRPVSFSSPGIGNTLHLAAETFASRAGIEMTHVPYKGAAPALTAVMSGEVQAMFIPPTTAVAQVKSGKLKAIGFSSTKRWSELPNVPTVAESLQGFTFDSGWHAVFAPAGTPAPIVARLNTEFRKAITVPEVRNFLIQGGYEPSGRPQAEFAAFVQSEEKRYAEIVRTAKITPE
ncbi:Bug family tripartite tricarboxylate transporter substrate binding protein [Hydrogenophaga laconesensis]|uniref:Tripartite-type tricarboxylate transporter receptor subunit TctC n=1 Tax=Hydrogenophaga laconesensis TaxID=1805971 RepID=A0ABU1V588_9BURK|nr:tripartite tricarboxylate transporter substrate binding protein [Hydrogenophaga laconesensis]MDR7092624.1 tripartite-type tricarboxylate transporter receptor subunit TctC [Hydrogenophaga laconesensis]